MKARALYNAGAIRVQRMVNSKMRAGDKKKTLTTLHRGVYVLVNEECSMTPAANCNMLDFRMMYGRAETHDVSEATYSDKHCAFGRCPIVIHLGDFLQLSPTNQLGLLTDANARREDACLHHRDTRRAIPPTPRRCHRAEDG